MKNGITKEDLEAIEVKVKDLKEPLKSMAIQKLLDQLSNTNSPIQNQRQRKIKKQKVKNGQNRSSGGREEIIKADEKKDKQMLELLNRTEYPAIHKLKGNLEKALYVLKIMKEKGYDSLNPSQIKIILTDVFNIKANTPAVSMVLINDKHYTLKEKMIYKGSKANKYRIMKSGEDYIDNCLKELNNSPQEDTTKG